jgi:peptide/nickel transport system permease protein
MSDGAENYPFFMKLGNIAWHLILPVTAMVYGSFAFLTRFSRSTMLEVIQQDYVRTALAKGVSKQRVIWHHAFRNQLIPLITLTGTLLPALLGGSIIIEQIFSIPGMGKLAFESVLARDYPTIMAIATIEAFLTLISLLLSDLAYVWVDPRITFEARGNA